MRELPLVYWPEKRGDMPQIVDTSACKHLHMQLISKDEETEYWECLDCGEIIEPCEAVSSQTRFQESLSDA